MEYTNDNTNIVMKIICISLNYDNLDKSNLDNLSDAYIKNDTESLKLFKKDLGIDVNSISIINKCNATIIVVSFEEDLSLDYIKGRLLTTWDKKSKNGIVNFLKDIKIFENVDALKFLAETAIGIHSVTFGDSQVLSQVTEGLNNGILNPKSPFKIINNWIEDIVKEVKLNTKIQDGNTSVERIACEFVDNKQKVLLIGFGKSGNLITKILTKEKDCYLNIFNRTDINIKNNNQISYFSEIKNKKMYKNIRYVFIAIDNNNQTQLIIDNMLSNLKNKNISFIDLSTPSILKNKVSNYIDIIKISKIANSNLDARKNEIGKVRNLINKKINLVVNNINKDFSKIDINNQKSIDFKKLSKQKIDIIFQRNEMYKFIRKFLETNGYIEVTTPYIVGISTDPPKIDNGGTINVEWSNNSTAFLRQSNQIYKQILVASGMKKIYEIGPFWRKETFESYRHLQESIGLDIEIRNPKSLEELYLNACLIIKNTNDDIIKKFSLKKQLIIPNIKQIPVFTYYEAVKFLNENGNPVNFGDDLGLVSESKLGQIIKRLYKSDIFIVKNYPDTIKKFYTKTKDSGLTETFDIIVDGWEVVSGAIRQNDGKMIRKSMSISGINADNYSFYISIINKSVKHGGFCIGLDRLLAKILNKQMISDVVAFPRTYKKLIP